MGSDEIKDELLSQETLQTFFLCGAMVLVGFQVGTRFAISEASKVPIDQILTSRGLAWFAPVQTANSYASLAAVVFLFLVLFSDYIWRVFDH